MPCLPLATNPTINANNCNSFAALSADDDDDEEHTVQTKGPQHNSNDTTTALSNSGATSHFIWDGAHVVNKQIDNNPITIMLPDGATIRSTHTCNMDIRGYDKRPPKHTLYQGWPTPHSLPLQNSVMLNTPSHLMPCNARFLMEQHLFSRVSATQPQICGAHHYNPQHRCHKTRCHRATLPTTAPTQLPKTRAHMK